MLMRHLSKVVWFEGMYLAPQHFQAQAHSFEDLVHFSTSNLWFEPYGILGQELDAESLRNGLVSLKHGRGIFPDGLIYDFPNSDPPPPSRNILDVFPVTHESTVLNLAVPPYQNGKANCTASNKEGSWNLRFSLEPKTFADQNSGCDEQTVHLGRKNIRFILDEEDSTNLVRLPIARITRDATGQLAYDPSFIPPCLQLSASPRLLTIARRLVGILEDKSRGLALARGLGGRSGFSSNEIASFWFVHTINSSLAVMRHITETDRAHPEQLFVEMSRLGGALCTFGIDSQPENLPIYDHLKLTDCIEKLDAHIRAHLELVVPSNCIAIPLKQRGQYFYDGEISDQRCLDRARWIFAVRSDIGELDLINRSQRLVKICSQELLPEIVKASLPGLPLAHLPLPPSAVAPKVEFQYFGVSRTGSCWESISKTRRVGIFVPGDIPRPELELLVILDS
jgi:type VI secretion system protein ImpJ